MKEKMARKRSDPVRGQKMVYSGDPIIPVKVESILSNIDRKMDDLNRTVSSIKDALITKADKGEVDKLEAKLYDLQRNGSDISRRVQDAERDQAGKVEVMDKELHSKIHEIEKDLNEKIIDLSLNSARKDAITDYERRLISAEKNTRLQWVGISITAFLALIEGLAFLMRH